jgi:TonB-dependent starch-binding outer membrane protein SusC
MNRSPIALAAGCVLLASTAGAQSPAAATCPAAPGAMSGPQRPGGASIGVVDSAMLAPAMARTLSEALTARLPGVSVMHSSGVAGTGSRIRLRGPSGILTTQEPLLFIDGMRAEGTAQSILLNAGGQAPSRVDDVPMENVECISVLRGPAATARYGTDAAGGVISVVTKGARPESATRVNGFIEGGGVKDAGEYPANYGTVSSTGVGGSCTRARVALGQCTVASVRSWSPIEGDMPFRTGQLLHGGGRVDVAAARSLSLGVNGSGTVDDGALRTNDHRRYDAGASADFHPDSTLSVHGDLWFMGGRTELPQVGNFIYSVLNSALLGSSVDDPVRRGYRNIPLSVIEQFGTEQQLQRLGGVVRATWRPMPWLSLSCLAGREDSRARDDQFDPGVRIVTNGFVVSPPQFEALAEQRAQRNSGNVEATATYRFGDLGFTSEIAFDYLGETQRSVQRTLDRGAQSQEVNYSYRWRNPSTKGLVARQALAWNDRLFIDAGVRRDVLARDFVTLENPTYPFANAAWDIVRGSKEHPEAFLSSLRLRGAYGESGDSRPYDAAVELAFTVPPGTTSEPSPVTVERTRELEGGFDVGLLGSRVTLGATIFSKRTSDALQQILVAPGVGTGARTAVANTAAWRNRGTEIDAHARLLDARGVRADVAIAYTTLHNEVTSLGGSPPVVSTSTRLEVGQPLQVLWGQRYTATDANGDGVIVPAEVTGDAGIQYLGSPVPTRELSVAPSLTLARAIIVAASFDYRGGFRTINSGGRLRCNGVCADLYMPNVPIAGQARAVNSGVATAAWIEDASFLKLREVSAAWTLPGGLSRMIGARSSSLVFAGRNLFTSTDYTGLNPEGTADGQTRIYQVDLFTLPTPRTFSLRFDARW